jgi:drug/metabolite transporter (DMT)-like permease
MTALEWTALVALALLWGGSFFFGKVAVAALPPLTVALSRVAIAALVLAVAGMIARVPLPRTRQVWLSFIAMGLLNNVIPMSLILWGQTEIASGLAAILNATTPLFTVIVAHWLTNDEKLSAGKIAGLMLGIAGVAVMLGPGALAHLDRTVVAELACLGAALSYALAGVFGRRFRRLGVPAPTAAFGQLAASSMLLIPIALVIDAPWRLPAPSPGVWGALLGLAVFSTAVAYIIYFRLLASAGATNLLLVTLLIPPAAILLGAVFLGERLMPIHFAGLALIAAGLAAIDGRVLETLSLRGRRRRWSA